METLEIAEKMVGRFSVDPVVAASIESELAHLCEKRLSIGVQASEWIFTASNAIRTIYVNDIELDEAIDLEEVSSKVKLLYEWWMRPCDEAEKLIEKVESLGYQVSNKKAYFKAKEMVKSKLESYGLRDLTEKAFCEGFFDGALIATSSND